MKGVLSAPAGPHRRICGDTDTPTHTHTHRRALVVKGTTLILAVFTQPPPTLPPTMLSHSVGMSRAAL